MVEMIGLTTVIALVWVLAATMTNECDAEKRRLVSSPLTSVDSQQRAPSFGTKHAA
jgi:hypothetical protein